MKGTEWKEELFGKIDDTIETEMSRRVKAGTTEVSPGVFFAVVTDCEDGETWSSNTYLESSHGQQHSHTWQFLLLAARQIGGKFGADDMRKALDWVWEMEGPKSNSDEQ